jgi:hypothetical protein
MTGKKTILILYTCLAFLILAATGCTHTMDMVNCKELFAEFSVDPAVARQDVPSGYSIRVDKNGMGTLLLMVQDCEKGILDGLIPIKPMRMSHIWIEIEGPEEVGPPLPGTTESLPTAYYYILPHQMESSLAHVALTLSGIDSQLVKEITLGERSGDQRLGQVIEKAPSVMYRWTETSRLGTTPNVMTGRRKFYRQYGWLIKLTSVGTVTCRSHFLGDGKVVLTASPDSAIGRLQFDTTFQGAAHPVEMSCRSEIKVHIK